MSEKVSGPDAAWLEDAVANDEMVLGSTTGKVWFQCMWDEEDGCWVTFNRYFENDRHQTAKRFKPTMFSPLPSPG